MQTEASLFDVKFGLDGMMKDVKRTGEITALNYETFE